MLNNLDERMLQVRGKGLLYGFLTMVVLIITKDFSQDLLNLNIESTTRIDFAIIYASMYIVLIYMTLNGGVSEEMINKSKKYYLFVTIIFLITFVSDIQSLFSYNGISNNLTTLVMLVFTLIQTIVTYYQSSQLDKVED